MSGKWSYGEAFQRYPCAEGIIKIAGNSYVKTHDIFQPLPAFMRKADMIFTDPPYNTALLRGFYTKAGLITDYDFPAFTKRLFECVAEINPKICYLEIGKEYLADYIAAMKSLYRYVTFYNSTYYHKPDNLCYIVRGSRKAKKPKLDGMDEETVIKWVCAHEDYQCIGDICIGRGLVGVEAAKAGRRFVGTELNHKRLSVLIERLDAMGIQYNAEVSGNGNQD